MKTNKLRGLVLTAFFLLLAAIPAAAQPDWAIGTFTARNPQTGGTITLTIESNGNVTADLDGTVNYGTYRNNRLTINGVSSRVSRRGDGIRTTRIDNGERIDYVRDNNNTGGGSGSGDVADWAVGNFTARNPQSGGTIYLTISQRGSVTVNLDGTVYYGTFRDNGLTLNGVTSSVRRNGNGIRTTRLDNGERIDYVRDNSGNGGGNNGGERGDVPNWAVGSFITSDPQTGRPIGMIITEDGNVTVNFEGGNTFYGTLYKDRLTIDGVTSRISRNGNGIRTTRLDNGEQLNYNRRR